MQSGGTLSLTCLVYSNSEDTVDVTWLYPQELNDAVVVNGDSLVVSELTMSVNFTCLATQRGTGASVRAAAAAILGEAQVDGFICCIEKKRKLKNALYQRKIITLFKPATHSWYFFKYLCKAVLSPVVLEDVSL